MIYSRKFGTYYFDLISIFFHNTNYVLIFTHSLSSQFESSRVQTAVFIYSFYQTILVSFNLFLIR